MCSLYRMVVLPAASRPSITTRISLLPNRESNRRVKVCPMLLLLLLDLLLLLALLLLLDLLPLLPLLLLPLEAPWS